jgi:hypothetical protein
MDFIVFEKDIALQRTSTVLILKYEIKNKNRMTEKNFELEL